MWMFMKEFFLRVYSNEFSNVGIFAYATIFHCGFHVTQYVFNWVNFTVLWRSRWNNWRWTVLHCPRATTVLWGRNRYLFDDNFIVNYSLNVKEIRAREELNDSGCFLVLRSLILTIYLLPISDIYLVLSIGSSPSSIDCWFHDGYTNLFVSN